MVKVECDGCKSTYEVEERRIPAAGLKMRCAKCGKSLLVTKDGSTRGAAPPPPAKRDSGPLRFDLDLPAIAPKEPALAASASAASLPQKRAKLESFGDLDSIVDLPSSSERGADLPSPARNQADLPAVAQGPRAAEGPKHMPKEPAFRPSSPAKPAVRPADFGDIDLPTAVAADLPSPVGADLPAPVAADLPASAGAELPARKDTTNQGTTARAVRKETFGELDLALTIGPEEAAELARLHDEAERETRSAEEQEGSRPPIEAEGARAAPIVEADLFDFPLEEGNLPLPDRAADAFDLGLAPLNEGPASSPSEPPGIFAGGSGGGLALDLEASSMTQPPDANEVKPAGAPSGGEMFGLSGGGDAGGLGGGILIAADSPQDLAREAKAKAKTAAPASPKEPQDQPTRRRSTAKIAALVSVAVIGGASLTLLPDIGPFGWNFIGDRINASAHASAFAEMKSQAQEDLDADTTTTTADALARARAAHARMPRHRGVAAYASFLAYTRTIRFGRKGGEDALGKQLLVFAQSAPSESLDLAVASQALADGKLDRARSSINYVLRRAPNDVDAAVIAGEIELSAGDKAKAVEAWRRAVAIKKSARTLYGEARAHLAAGDVDAAMTSARGALAASPRHIGVSSLLASTLWQREGGEAEAITLLTKVTSPGEIRDSASERELIEAESLLGEIHLARSRISAADAAFNAALKIDPQAMRALLGSGELFYRSGRYSEASARFEAATRADAANVDAQIGTAKTTLALERAKEAKDILKKARAANAKNESTGTIAYWQGRVEEALGNKKEAEAAYLEVIGMGGAGREVIDAYVALTYLLSSLGRHDEAGAKLAEATSKFPERPALHKAKGDVALQTGRYDEARSEYEAALARQDDLGTRFKLATALRRGRSYAEAAAALDTIEATDKEFPGLALERGLLFEETGDRKKALEMYAAALQKAPNDLDLKLRVGSAQVMAGQPQEAETILRDVLKVRPQSAEANHFMGRAMLLRGTTATEAMRFLDRAVELDPNRAEYFVYVAWAANDSNQATRAQSAIERALSLDQENGDAYWQRGVLLQKQGSSVDALKDLQTALAKRPSRFEAYATMALCFQDLNRWPEAEEAFRKAIAGSSAVPEWHYRLAKIYLARGNRPGAQTEIEKALELVEASAKPPPAWLFDAHFLEAELLRGSGQGLKAVDHYKAFLATAPSGNVYRADAEKALRALGAIR